MLNIDPEKLEKMVVAEAANQLLATPSEDGGDRFGRILSDIRKEVDKRIDNIFAERVNAIIAEEVNRSIEAGFEREYQRHDNFGKKVGGPTTIRKELEKLVSDYWSKRVDRGGRETHSSYGSTSRAEWVLIQALGDDFAKQFKQQAVNIAGHVKDGLRQSMRDWMDQSLGEVFNVQSATDKAEKRRK